MIIANTHFQQPKRDSTQADRNMINAQIRSIMFFAAKDREALYSQSNQDLELTVAHIMNSFLYDSGLN